MSFSIPTPIYQRLRSVVRYVCDGRSGVVKEQEIACGYARDTLYRDCHRVVEAFRPKPPGPKPDPTRPLLGRIADLEREKGVLQAQVADLNALLSRCVEVTPERIENLVLTAVVTPPSYVGAGALVEVAFGRSHRPSPAKVSQTVTHFGQEAGHILSRPAVTDRFEEANADELFGGRRPILTVVEPASLAIGAVEVSNRRSGDDWHDVFERFRYLRYVTSDLGKGLCAGISLSEQIQRHGPDLWHLVVRPLSRITRALDADLQRQWDREQDAIKKQQRPKGQGKLYAPTVAHIQAEVASHFDRMEDYYQGIECLFEALTPIVDEPGAPRLRTLDDAQTRLDTALCQLETLHEPRLSKTLKTLRAHQNELLFPLQQLHDSLDTIKLEGVDDPTAIPKLRMLVVKEILLTRQRAQSNDPTTVTAFQQLWGEIAALGSLLRFYKAWRKAVAACLYQPRRTSSLVECVNSPLRTLQQIHRHLSQPLADLFALHWNLKTFGSGCRRQGKSPYQLLGVDLGSDNWLELLRTYRMRA